MTRDLDRPLRDAWIVSAVRTPIGRYGGALASRPPGRPGRARRSQAVVDALGRRPGAHRGRDPRLRQPGRRGQPQRGAHGGAAGRPARSRSAVRPSTGCAAAASRPSTRPRTRSWSGDGDVFVGRRRRVDDPRAVRRWPSPRRPSTAAPRELVRHDPRLALHQPAPGRDAPPVLDGRDRRERRRAVRRLARGPGRLRAAQSTSARSRPSRPAASRTRSCRSRCRSRRATRSSIARDEHPRADTTAGGAGAAAPGVPRRRHRSRPATARASTTAPRRCSSSRRPRRASSG